MARVFTTTFLYQEKHYLAVVSACQGKINSYVPDSSLHSILPDGRITLEAEKGLACSKTDLVRVILDAAGLPPDPFVNPTTKVK